MQKYTNWLHYYGKFGSTILWVQYVSWTACLYSCPNNCHKGSFLQPHHSQIKPWTKVKTLLGSVLRPYFNYLPRCHLLGFIQQFGNYLEKTKGVNIGIFCYLSIYELLCESIFLWLIKGNSYITQSNLTKGTFPEIWRPWKQSQSIAPV